MAVIHGEIGDYDGHRQRYREYAGQGAQRAHEHPNVCLGHHVAVPHRGHRHQRPPQPQRDALEVVVGVGLDAFGVVHQAGEDHDAQYEKKHQQGELLGGGAERLDEDLQPRGVPGELEQPHDADDGEELHDVGVLQVRGELPQYL